MKRLILATLFLSVMALSAQTPPPAPNPVKVEVIPAKTALSTDHLRDAAELAISRQDTAAARAQVLQGQLDTTMKQQLGPLQETYNTNEKIIQEYIDATKKANGWGDDVTFDKPTMKFFRTPKPVTQVPNPPTPAETPTK